MRVQVGRYGQWVMRKFEGPDGMDLTNTRQLASDGKSLWLLLDEGVLRFDGCEWLFVEGAWEETPSRFLLRRDGSFWVSVGNRLWIR